MKCRLIFSVLVGVPLCILLAPGFAAAQQLQSVNLIPQASQPFACTSATRSALYFSSSTGQLRVCAVEWNSVYAGTAVTSVGTGQGLSGGPVTGSGTIALSINGGVAQACSGSQKVSTVSPFGIVTCTNDIDTNSGGTVTNSGASAGYVPLFTSASNIANSVLYQNGQNIGVGTTGASRRLDILGSTRVSGSGNATEDASLFQVVGYTGSPEVLNVDATGRIVRVGGGAENGIVPLEVRGAGAIRLNSQAPNGYGPSIACGAGARGTLAFVNGYPGVSDSLWLCAKNASDAYAWRAVVQ